MITVKVLRNYTEYKVYLLDRLILEAKDKSSFFNPDRIEFFDNSKQFLAKSKQRSFLGFNISHKLYLKDGQIVTLHEGIKTTDFVINKIQYCIKRTRTKTHDLFKNKIQVGQLMKISNGVSSYENSITCNNIEDCLTFSMISILLYTFDVN